MRARAIRGSPTGLLVAPLGRMNCGELRPHCGAGCRDQEREGPLQVGVLVPRASSSMHVLGGRPPESCFLKHSVRVVAGPGTLPPGVELRSVFLLRAFRNGHLGQWLVTLLL